MSLDPGDAVDPIRLGDRTRDVDHGLALDREHRRGTGTARGDREDAGPRADVDDDITSLHDLADRAQERVGAHAVVE